MDTYDYIKSLVETRRRLVTHNRNRPAPSWVNISTITMISKFSSPVDISNFESKFREVAVRPAGSSGPGFTWRLNKDCNFYNQVTINYTDDYSKKSVKLFPNGSVHVCGCSNPVDCQRVLNQIKFLVKTFLDQNVELEAPVICMINTNFSLNTTVNLKKVLTKFNSPNLTSKFRVSYDPSRYSAVKIKFIPGEGMKRVTASVFKTGRILVTGAKQLDEIAAAYRILNLELTDDLFVSRTATEEKFDLIMGATYDEWYRVLQNKNIQQS